VPYCVGLTGGIGSGKTAVSSLFAELGVAIIDTDEISRELTAPSGAAIAAIREQFGPGLIAVDGGLDRARMRELVFGDPGARRKLEAILHPLIQTRARSAIAAAQHAPYAIAVVPLLFETGAYANFVRRVLVVDCDEREQLRRVMARSSITAGEASRIMSAQMARAERVKRADDVIDNSGPREALREPVARLHRKYLELARAG